MSNYFSEEDLCNPGKLLEKLAASWKSFLEDVQRAMASLIRGGLGKTILIIAAMLASMAAVRLITAVQSLVNLVFTNISAAISAMVGMFLAMFKGADLILKYYATKELIRALQSRRNLALNLQIDINSLLTILNSISIAEDFLTNVNTIQTKQALLHVKRARLILNREISVIEKHLTPPAQAQINVSTGYTAETPIPRKVETVVQALDQIDRALVLLGVELNSDASKQGINLTKSVDTFEATPVIAVDTAPKLYDSIKSFKLPTRDELKKMGIAERDALVQKVLQDPAVNSTIKAYLLLSIMRIHIDNLSKHTPVLFPALVSAGIEKLTGSSISDMMAPVSEFGEDKLGIFTPTLSSGHYEKNVYWSTAMDLTQALEFGVLMMDRWIKTIKMEFGYVKTFLKAADARLIISETELTQNLTATNPSGFRAAYSNTTAIINLVAAKEILRGAQSRDISYSVNSKKTTINSDTTNTTFEDAYVIYGNLQMFIANKNIDSKTKKLKKEPGEQYYEFAEKTMSKLSFGELTQLSRASRKKTTAGLQAMRFTLVKQIELDLAELAMATQFVTMLENDPLFAKMLEEFEVALNGLGLGADQLEAIKKGKISEWVMGLSLARREFDKIGGILDCLGIELKEEGRQFVKRFEDSIMTNIFGGGDALNGIKTGMAARLQKIKTMKQQIINQTAALTAMGEEIQTQIDAKLEKVEKEKQRQQAIADANKKALERKRDKALRALTETIT